MGWADVASGFTRVTPYFTLFSGAKAIDPNNLRHIFDNAEHKLDDVVEALGSREAAFEAMEKVAQAAVDAGNLTGEFKVVIDLAGVNVEVTGKVIDGVARIGTAYRL